MWIYLDNYYNNITILQYYNIKILQYYTIYGIRNKNAPKFWDTTGSIFIS